MNLNKLLGFIADIIFPPICPVCNKIMPIMAGDICPECEKKLTFVAEPYCMRCGKPVDETQEYCEDCTRRDHAYDEGRAVLIYDEYMSKSIYRFKYNGKREFARFYGRVMTQCLHDKIRQWRVEVVIPVPVHKSKLRQRGYNQAGLIAQQISKRLKIPVKSDIVIRQTATKVQKNLGFTARQNNLKNAFKVIPNSVKYKSVLIVDDIYTTGATVDAMARCLKKAGVEKVYFATLCIGRGN